MEFVELSIFVWECIAPQLSYLDDIKGKVRKLREKVGDLSALMEDVKTEVERPDGHPTAQAKWWLRKADRILGRAKAAIDEARTVIKMEEEEEEEEEEGGGRSAGKQSGGCCESCCINCNSRYRVGKHVTRASKEVARHNEEGRALRVSHNFPMHKPPDHASPQPPRNDDKEDKNKPVEALTKSIERKENGTVEPTPLPPPPPPDDARNGKKNDKSYPVDQAPFTLGVSPPAAAAGAAGINGDGRKLKPNPVEPVVPSPPVPSALPKVGSRNDNRGPSPHDQLGTRHESSSSVRTEDGKPMKIP